jgi:hypothetical protein
MNTSAANLLRSLDQLGVQGISFRILGVGRALRHTAPVTLSSEAIKPVALSVSDLFAAYGIAPRQGSYELNVENGSLIFIPPALRAEVQRPRLALMKKHRAKLKSQNRRVRASFNATPHKLAA